MASPQDAPSPRAFEAHNENDLVAFARALSYVSPREGGEVILYAAMGRLAFIAAEHAAEAAEYVARGSGDAASRARRAAD